jgi:hypothetical protein
MELVYLIGGEFTTVTESHFNHFSDLWSFNPKSLQWKNLTSVAKGSAPSPRSGHRASVWGNSIVVFGGFNDTGKGVKYFNDLHIFDVKTSAWQKFVENKGANQRWPCPRSACGLVILCDSVFVFGGYSRSSSGSDISSEGSRGRVHWDLWRLHLATRTWEEVAMKGPVPAPRAGFAVAGDGAASFIVFGGVHDEYTSDALLSDFYSDWHRFRVDAAAWEPVAAAAGPQARMGASLAAQGGRLVLFGGKTDKDDREVTLDDVWVSDPPEAAGRGGDGATGRLRFRLAQGLLAACAVWLSDDSDGGGESSSEGDSASEASGGDDNTLQAYRRLRPRGRQRTAVRYSSPTTSQEGWGDEDWPDPAGLSDRSSESSGSGGE